MQCKVCGGALRASNKIGICRRTPECSRERSRIWRELHPEASRTASRRWRSDNPDKVQENNQRWREANPNYFRQWYAENQSADRAAGRRYRTSLHGKSVMLLRHARTRAEKRGIPFDLTLEWVTTELDIALRRGCPYLGIPIILDAEGTHDPHSPTIDQFNPGAGYTQDNCIIVSHKANAMKNDAPPEFVKRLGDNVDLLARTRFKAYNPHVVAQAGVR